MKFSIPILFGLFLFFLVGCSRSFIRGPKIPLIGMKDGKEVISYVSAKKYNRSVGKSMKQFNDEIVEVLDEEHKKERLSFSRVDLGLMVAIGLGLGPVELEFEPQFRLTFAKK